MTFVHEAAHFAHQRDVLRHVPRLCAELRVILDEALHVCDALDVLVAL